MNCPEGYYQGLFDSLLSQELQYNSYAATEHNIRTAMKRILGQSIKQGVIRNYSFLVLDSELNVHFTIIDPEGLQIPLVLYYGS